MNTRRAYSVLLGFIGAVVGLVLAMLLMSFERSCPPIVNVAGAPALWLFERWHDLGLPPQGEAALAGPYFAFFIWWIAVGAIAGALFGWWRRAGQRV